MKLKHNIGGCTSHFAKNTVYFRWLSDWQYRIRLIFAVELEADRRTRYLGEHPGLFFRDVGYTPCDVPTQRNC